MAYFMCITLRFQNYSLEFENPGVMDPSMFDDT